MTERRKARSAANYSPAVSVIIPVYNTAPYLRRCLDSVCGQTLRNIEVICINDGSTDNSLEILREYERKDNGVTVIDFAKNRGVSAARNAGIDAARGEYVGFVDSDDFPENDFYEKLYMRAKETNADVAKGNYKSFKNGSVDSYLNNKIKEQKTNFAFTHCSGIYRNSMLKEHNLRYPALTDMEDPVFAFKIAITANKIEIVDTNIIIVEREDSCTNGIPSLKQVKEKFKGFQMIIDIANANAIHEQSYGFVTALWYVVTINNSFKTRDINTRRFIAEKSLEYFNMLKEKKYFQVEMEKLHDKFYLYFKDKGSQEIFYYPEDLRIDEQTRKIDEQAQKMDEQARKIDEQARKIDEQTRKIDEQARKIDEQARKIGSYLRNKLTINRRVRLDGK